MRIKYLRRREGAAPLEVVVTILTARGETEQVMVHRGYLDERSFEVTYISEQNGLLFVELPGESISGRSRIWVRKSAVA